MGIYLVYMGVNMGIYGVNMAKYVYMWVYMGIYEYILEYMGIYGYIWVHFDMDGYIKYISVNMGIYGYSYGCFRHWKCHFGACGAPWTKNTKNLKSPRNGKRDWDVNRYHLGHPKGCQEGKNEEKKTTCSDFFFWISWNPFFGFHGFQDFTDHPVGSNYLVRGTLCQKMSQIGWQMAKRQPKTYHKSKNSKKQQKFKNWASELKFGPIGLKLAPNKMIIPMHD